ncbi:MAG: DUF1501 domain-containing protein [Chthoniobacteraceae bacterium]
MSQPISRRQFLRHANCAAISSLPILSTLLNLKLAGSLAAAPAPTDHRALVCLFLSGGADSYNILVPYGDAEHDEYTTARGGIALPKTSLLPLNLANTGGLKLGLHSALPGLNQLFTDGKAAAIANVGTLIEKVTKDDYNSDAPALRYPLNLYSHSDQIEQWQTSMADRRSVKGWAGRAADLLHSLNADQRVSMNISLSGSNIWQSGENTLEYAVSNDGAIGLSGYDPKNDNSYDPVFYRTKAVDSQLGFQYQHLLSQAFNTQKSSALDSFAHFNQATNAVTIPDGTFPGDNYLAAQFKMIAKAIASHDAIGQARQTFFIEYSGWDTHDGVIKHHADALPEVDAAIKAFYDYLASVGLENNVTLFTASDFGRTISTDNDGADHAWGGNQFVIGGAVKGNKLYGTYPSLYVDNPLDVGRGRLIPQISVDEFFGELALWFGVPRSDLATVIPNIGNFYNVNSTGTPLGFL